MTKMSVFEDNSVVFNVTEVDKINDISAKNNHQLKTGVEETMK